MSNKKWRLLLQELENFTRIIRELRQSYGFTQKQVAEKLEVTYQSYQAYERGIALPNLKNFLKLANIYDVSLDYLVGRKEY